MADPAEHRDDDESRGTPRWVKVSAGIALAVMVVIALVLLLGGGDHGPGRHTGLHLDVAAERGARTAPATGPPSAPGLLRS